MKCHGHWFSVVRWHQFENPESFFLWKTEVALLSGKKNSSRHILNACLEGPCQCWPGAPNQIHSPIKVWMDPYKVQFATESVLVMDITCLMHSWFFGKFTHYSVCHDIDVVLRIYQKGPLSCPPRPWENLLIATAHPAPTVVVLSCSTTGWRIQVPEGACH